MSDDYSGYEDDPTAHDGYAPDTHDVAGIESAIGQPIGGLYETGHEDTTTYPAEEGQADPYANEEQAAPYATEGQADPYAAEGQQTPFGGHQFGQQEESYPAQQPASEADPYAADSGDHAPAAEGRDAFQSGTATA